MISEQPYWNPVLETMDPEKLQILQLKSFSVFFSELMIVPNFIAVYMTRPMKTINGCI